MIIEHVAIWTNRLEEMRDFYVRFFEGVSNEKYINRERGYQSYFISFSTGARLELMQMEGIPENRNDTIAQHLGIIHLAFGVDTIEQVESKAEQLRKAGFRILKGPRRTGDGYYEFEALDPDNNRFEVCTPDKGH
jgi:lactoylglutathione lyase